MQLAEAEVVMSGKRTHAELVSQPHSAPVVGLRLLHVGRIAASGLSFAKASSDSFISTEIRQPVQRPQDAGLG
jgi:hypothetical protein